MATFASSVLLAIVYYYLYFHEHKSYLRIWSVAWLIYSIRYFFDLLSLTMGGSPILLLCNQLSAMVSGAFLVWGTYVFLGLRFPRAWIYLTAAGLLWITIAVISDWPFILITIPTFAFLGAIMVWTGVVFVRTSRLDPLMRNVLGWAFILWGLHKLDYPLLRPVAWFAPWGFMIASILALIIAIGIILLYFKIAKSDLMLFQFALDNIEDEVFLISSEGRFEYANQKACATLEYTKDEMLGMGIPDVDPLFPTENMAAHIDELKQKGHLRFESVHRTRSGVEYPVEVLANYVLYGGREYNLAFGRDITARKESERRIMNSLGEKEVLLAELHHRVKNNLAIILSLLRMQGADVKDEAVAEMLRESQSRIRSMALVHEKLYKAGNLAQIDVQDYITELATDIRASFGGKRAAALDLHLERIFIDIDTLIPCGLIINELVTNAFKHALRGVEGARLTIGMRKSGDNIELSVADNGAGLPEKINLASGGLGLKLIQILSDQISAKVTIERKGGTKFMLVFPEKAE